ncbi:MAG: hypothetical protein HKO89_04300 [Saprospiraceae bacterium]|nr:hypothetical protein [Bacteroidia bacterium]NNK89807.1 hypothetical protein [Saprospiraceae bacterium]
MNKTTHRLYVWTMVLIVIVVTIYLSYSGYSYYQTSLEERFYHPRHDWFKPSGLYGHGLGIIGTFMILFGVSIYILRKRYNFLSKLIRLKHLLEFHIFLCTMGPILILFHTAFKFGGIVSVAFWSMVAVVLSGVIGRFIYIQIPRTIEGRELSLQEVQKMKSDPLELLKGQNQVPDDLEQLINTATDSSGEQKGIVAKYLIDHKRVKEIGRFLKTTGLVKSKRKIIIKAVRQEISLSNRIARLQTMQKLFKYWHVAHLPFALIMLIIVVIHVVVTLAFGYKWIF